MVAYNYSVFNSNIVQNMEEIGSTNLAKIAEELEAYLNKGMNVVQTTTVSVEYMMANDTSSEEIDDNFTGIYGLFNDDYIDGIG